MSLLIYENKSPWRPGMGRVCGVSCPRVAADPRLTDDTSRSRSRDFLFGAGRSRGEEPHNPEPACAGCRVCDSRAPFQHLHHALTASSSSPPACCPFARPPRCCLRLRPKGWVRRQRQAKGRRAACGRRPRRRRGLALAWRSPARQAGSGGGGDSLPPRQFSGGLGSGLSGPSGSGGGGPCTAKVCLGA